MNPKRHIPIKRSIATQLLKVVFSFYLIIAVCVTVGHMVMEFRYQKANIKRDLIGIQNSFEQNLAIDIWNIDKESLRSTIDGILKIPVVVGVRITDVNGTDIVLGRISSHGESDDKYDDVHINPLGLGKGDTESHIAEIYRPDVIAHQFPIAYFFQEKEKQLGEATIYSSSSMVFQRVKLGFLLLVVNAVLKTVALWLIFLWCSNFLLRKPLASLADAAEKVSLDNLASFKVRVHTSSKNELKVLEESFNSMIGNLHRSIVEQKRIERDMLFVKFAVDHISDAAFWIDTDGNFTYVNEAACWNLGYTREELLNLSVKDIDQNFPGDIWASHWEDLKTKGSLQFETIHRTKNGKMFPVEVVANFMKFEKSEYNCAIARDISERKKMELQLQQSQKMEAIGNLAGGIAHDFNNILAAIIGYAELLDGSFGVGSEAWGYQQEILKASDRATELVKQILTFSRQAEHDLKPFQIHIIVKEALKLLRASIPTSIEIHERIDSECGAVLADPIQIHQVMMNLCTNAYHAMRETGGILEVELKQIEITRQESKVSALQLAAGPYLVLKVSDSGHGMDRATMARVFDPYFTTKKIGEGTGMGLAVVHGIVKSYGGHISVYSEHGKGTSFQVYLPKVITASIEEETEHQDQDVPSGNERILLVDDEETILLMEQRILEQLGYKVTTMLSSKDALQVFCAQPGNFDLVVTDMTMPGMTGAELSQRLLTVRPDIPIIMCTGFSEVINEEKAHAIGIREYMIKPVVRSEMARIIRKALDKL